MKVIMAGERQLMLRTGLLTQRRVDRDDERREQAAQPRRGPTEEFEPQPGGPSTR